MKPNVFVQIRRITERSKADSTLQRLVARVRAKMNLQAVFAIVDLPATRMVMENEGRSVLPCRRRDTDEPCAVDHRCPAM